MYVALIWKVCGNSLCSNRSLIHPPQGLLTWCPSTWNVPFQTLCMVHLFPSLQNAAGAELTGLIPFPMFLPYLLLWRDWEGYHLTFSAFLATWTITWQHLCQGDIKGSLVGETSRKNVCFTDKREQTYPETLIKRGAEEAKVVPVHSWLESWPT